MERRLGLYTGKVYKSDEMKTMQECGVAISNEADENYIRRRRAADFATCMSCKGCPESQI